MNVYIFIMSKIKKRALLIKELKERHIDLEFWWRFINEINEAMNFCDLRPMLMNTEGGPLVLYDIVKIGKPIILKYTMERNFDSLEDLADYLLYLDQQGRIIKNKIIFKRN